MKQIGRNITGLLSCIGFVNGKTFVQLAVMTRLPKVVLIFMFLLLTGACDGKPTETVLGAPGGTVTLPCVGSAENQTLFSTSWFKEGKIVASRNQSSNITMAEDSRFSISDRQNLTITNLKETDQGLYNCNTSRQYFTVLEDIQLLIVSGPVQVVMDIQPATALTHDTFFVNNGSSVTIRCSSKSNPSQNLSLIFEDVKILTSSPLSSLEFHLHNIQPTNQGLYRCVARNLLSNVTVTNTTQLFVYHAPEGHPECYSKTGNDSTELLLHCSWPGGYPAPTLRWAEVLGAQTTKKPVLNVSNNADTLEVLFNRTLLYDRQPLVCVSVYQTSDLVKTDSCDITLLSPYPEGEPLVTAVEGGNITLSCEEARSVPVAKTTWRRTLKEDVIIPSSRHIISQEGPMLRLTIVNVTQQDEGAYFCRSENPVQDIELEIILTVKSSARNTGGIIGAFLAVLIFGAGIAIGLSAYRHRDRICLGNAFIHMGEERTDVFNLVESEDENEEVVADTTMTTVANGHPSSLVQVHCFLSSDNEDQDGTPTEERDNVPAPEQPEVTE
ncbi:V-set and immunoglobulin domain-containing protein 10 [Brienomyrus brachyistius]|uniref:V-set and immunoglobulin domain-containing protein 10 n=1 Tax=Brienomyrus brachyistius TaxID=42636 RepID=UPI0020B189D3|nr:V-set and immunoglobulin domain-containing protein 10 [Brienomyrus brachyistius]